MIDSRPHFHVICKPKSFSKITINSSQGDDYMLWITSGYFFFSVSITLPSQMCLCWTASGLVYTHTHAHIPWVYLVYFKIFPAMEEKFLKISKDLSTRCISIAALIFIWPLSLRLFCSYHLLFLKSKNIFLLLPQSSFATSFTSLAPTFIISSGSNYYPSREF